MCVFHRKQGKKKDAIPTEKELQEQMLREQEQKRRAEQLTLQFEQQIKEQQHHLRMQKKAQAEREKQLLNEKSRLEKVQTEKRRPETAVGGRGKGKRGRKPGGGVGREVKMEEMPVVERPRGKSKGEKRRRMMMESL